MLPSFGNAGQNLVRFGTPGKSTTTTTDDSTKTPLINIAWLQLPRPADPHPAPCVLKGLDAEGGRPPDSPKPPTLRQTSAHALRLFQLAPTQPRLTPTPPQLTLTPPRLTLTPPRPTPTPPQLTPTPPRLTPTPPRLTLTAPWPTSTPSPQPLTLTLDLPNPENHPRCSRSSPPIINSTPWFLRPIPEYHNNLGATRVPK
ncbi:hypothetical protein E4T56_gene18531 [Termitomyces sp. T112]|nr:hypothetical protein E4T56_gene18531 [Termitomyces sp. T112]